jgi:formiminoglutamate deiminase
MLWFERALTPSGWAERVRLTVAGGLIEGIETGVEPRPGDARHAVALPGLPNLHSHAFQRAMAGLTERRGATADSFWTWREAMYRFVDRIGPDDLHAIAAMAFVEMLESGFTRVGEFHYLHHDPDGRPYADPAEMGGALARAAEETGIALTLLPVFYAHGGFGGQPAGHGQRRFLSGIDSFAALLDASRAAVAPLPDAIVGIAPHSLRAVTPDELAALGPLADGAPVHIHVAEQVKEVDDCLAWSGARPVAWLLEHAPVGPNWCAVHATHMTPEETARLAATGATAGLCPITEANLGDGLFPAAAWLAAGGRFGVGSDSNVLIDAGEELRLLEYGQRLTARARNLFAPGPDSSTGAALFTGALAGAAQALGAPAGIAVGRPADLFTLAADDPRLPSLSGDAPLDAFVFAGARPDRVWRRGVEVVASGRHRAREAVSARYRKVLAKLIA